MNRHTQINKSAVTHNIACNSTVQSCVGQVPGCSLRRCYSSNIGVICEDPYAAGLQQPNPLFLASWCTASTIQPPNLLLEAGYTATTQRRKQRRCYLRKHHLRDWTAWIVFLVKVEPIHHTKQVVNRRELSPIVCTCNESVISQH